MGRSELSRGFSLMELMVVVAILAVFASLAIPGFVSFVNNNRTQAASNELLGFLQYARSNAVQNKTNLVACLSNGEWTLKKACTDTTALRTLAKPSNVDVASNPTSISFRSNGSTSSSTNITICRDGNFAEGFTLDVRNSGILRVWPRGKKMNFSATPAALTNMSTCTP